MAEPHRPYWHDYEEDERRPIEARPMSFRVIIWIAAIEILGFAVIGWLAWLVFR